MQGNCITKVAIVGASGNAGKAITSALLTTPSLHLTALTRTESTSTFPPAIAVQRADFTSIPSLTQALRGHDALVITLSGRADVGKVEENLVRAAAEAGVAWIVPNEWSPDSANEGLVRDMRVFEPKGATRKLIKQLGKSSYVAVSTGFWYEYSLAIGPSFGFDFEKKEVTFFDDGETKITVSTWPQVGRAVAAILNLPISAEGDNPERSLESLRNKLIYIGSFTLSQRDMLASVLRVTGAKEEDWTVKKQPSRERYQGGVAKMQSGDYIGMVEAMYSRVFYQDGTGDVETHKGLANKMLGLAECDVDEATNIAIQRSKEKPFGH